MARISTSWTMLRALGVLGVLAIVVGAGGLVAVRVARPEKAAVYLLGHWFDVIWEIFIPLLVAGVVITAIALGLWLRASRGRRPRR